MHVVVMTDPSEFDITAAREVIERYDSVTALGGYGAGDHAHLASALRAALAEVERLRAQAPTPPADDEREALANLIPLGFTERDPVRNVYEAADRIHAAGWRRQGSLTEAEIVLGASKYAEHVTGYSMRDGGYTYTCRCGWSETGPDAGSAAQKHRMRAALEAARAAVPTGEEPKP